MKKLILLILLSITIVSYGQQTQIIPANVGAPGHGTGDKLWQALTKLNNNDHFLDSAGVERLDSLITAGFGGGGGSGWSTSGTTTLTDAPVINISEVELKFVPSLGGKFNIEGPVQGGGFEFRTDDIDDEAIFLSAFSNTNGGAALQMNFSSGQKIFRVSDFRSGVDRKGLEYQSDYSANYSNRSLVDKQYVDNAVAAGGTIFTFSEGLTEEAGTAVLGGDISSTISVGLNFIGNGGGLNASLNGVSGHVAIGDTGSGYGLYVNKNSSGFSASISSRDEPQTGSFLFKVDVPNDDVEFIDARTIPKGVEYQQDYSANFTERSLVDKAYVDKNTVEMQSEDYVINATTDGNKFFTNEFAAGQVIFTLPAATAGRSYTFYVVEPETLRINACGGCTIRVAGSATASNGNITNAVTGGTITLIAIGSNRWVSKSHEGTWTVN